MHFYNVENLNFLFNINVMSFEMTLRQQDLKFYSTLDILTRTMIFGIEMEGTRKISDAHKKILESCCGRNWKNLYPSNVVIVKDIE